MMKNPKISVVIGTFNLLPKLELVLDSLNKQTFDLKLVEVIVVDSNSTDGTKECLEKNTYEFNLKFISQENKGKASARNRGVREASSNIILITDADMIAHPDLIKSHYELQKENQFNVIIEGKTWVLTTETLPVTDYIKRPYITHKVKHKQKLDFYYCLTGNLSMPKSFFIECGFFDETYQSYGWEDVDLGYRLIRKHRKKIIYSDLAQNYHYHVWTDSQEIERRFNMGKSVHILVNKFPELKRFLGINIINFYIYKIFLKQEALTNKWLSILSQDLKLSKFKKMVLREFYYYKGYESAIK
ncbi:MAG: hypothetical protein A2Y40_00350 [Candidatus Margulisbacteria bacterium GWF2_35_9]|nr:MAG: hypothetical protein A2Y40_00350 [Candidatus Margulisbacteria bacterium GWF2_35_9]